MRSGANRTPIPAEQARFTRPGSAVSGFERLGRQVSREPPLTRVIVPQSGVKRNQYLSNEVRGARSDERKESEVQGGKSVLLLTFATHPPILFDI